LTGQFTATTKPLQKFTTFGIGQKYSPIPNQFYEHMNKIENYVNDIMNITSVMVQIQGPLTSSTGLNTQVTNSTAAILLNQALQPFRANYSLFFQLGSSSPLYYSKIFDNYKHLKGTKDVMWSLISELKNKLGLSDSKLKYFIDRYTIFTTQDLKYYAIKSFSETVKNDYWINEFLAYLNSSANTNSELLNYLTKFSPYNTTITNLFSFNISNSGLKLEYINFFINLFYSLLYNRLIYIIVHLKN
jgi:hypothetical protein